MENQENKIWLDYIAEIQKALEPLKYEIVGFDTKHGEPLVIKLVKVQ
jgi:hypothetical protein